MWTATLTKAKSFGESGVINQFDEEACLENRLQEDRRVSMNSTFIVSTRIWFDTLAGVWMREREAVENLLKALWVAL